MNSNGLALTANIPLQARPAFYWTLADMLVLAKRQLMHIPRSPQELGAAMVQPVLILVLFRYVFGGAIAVPPHSQHLYLPRRLGSWSADRLPASGHNPELGSGTWPDPADRLSVHLVLGVPRIGVKQRGSSLGVHHRGARAGAQPA